MNHHLSKRETEALLDILIELLGVQPEQLTPEARIQEDLGADSLTVIEIVMAVEERFSLSIPDEEAEKVSTVEDLFETIARFLEATSQRGG